MSDIYPLVIVKDRYNGTYSGGKWTAWNMCYVPSKIFEDDKECAAFFAKENLIFGKGETPQEAIEDLKCMLQRGSHIHKEHIKAVSESTDDEEDNEMKATSVQNIKNVKDICFSIENDPIEMESKLIVVASTNDDIFAFEFEGEHIIQSCEKAGFFSGWEKDQKIREKNRKINELCHKLYQVERDKERLTDKCNLTKAANERIKENAAKIAKENEELKTKSKDISNDNALLLETNKKLIQKNLKLKEENEQYKEAAERRFNEKLHDFEVNNKKYDGKIMEEILKRNSGRYSLDEEKSSADEKPSTRRDILKAAKKCVCGQREQDYGTPESNFQIIANLWNDYLGLAENGDGVPIFSIKNITPTDVSMMMALLKIARIRNGGGSGDSFVDLAGYAACGGEIWAGQKHQKDLN